MQGSVASQAGARSRLLPAAVHAPVAATMARCCSPTSSPAPARSRPPGPARRRPGRSRSCCAARAWTRSGRSPPGWPASRELVDHIRALPCDTAVLDGETLALDDEGRPRAFQGTMSRFGSDAPDAGVPLSPFLFDLLHLDGRDLLDEPLHAASTRSRTWPPTNTRRSACPASTAQSPGRRRTCWTMRSPPVPRASWSRPWTRPTPPAGPAGRTRRSWQKIVAAHPLDLVVIGADWGYGRRSGQLSNIHLGARDPDGGEPVMVGTTFKGMTDQLLDWQTRTFPEHARGRADWGGSTCDRNSSSRSRSTARSAVPATRAASHCGSPACCGTGRTRPRPRPTPSRRVRALLAGAADQIGGVPGPGAVPSSVPLTP
ncbi:MAG: ligB [Modestobacter sp.]|nr:ligB [Modestobacter sp.]